MLGENIRILGSLLHMHIQQLVNAQLVWVNIQVCTSANVSKQKTHLKNKRSIIKHKIKQKKMMWGGKKNVIFQLEVTANPLKSQSQTNSTCLCQTGRKRQRLAETGRVQD